MSVDTDLDRPERCTGEPVLDRLQRLNQGPVGLLASLHLDLAIRSKGDASSGEERSQASEQLLRVLEVSGYDANDHRDHPVLDRILAVWFATLKDAKLISR
jgi:hypothetical protein